MTPKVSILVPIYNVEDYIEKCAKSLFEQNYTNCQFIFVDDASPDGSIAKLEALIERFPERETKIVRHTSNQGVATARNTALDNATGDYVIFIDSDDWVDDTLIERLVDLAMAHKADITNAFCASAYSDGTIKGVETPWFETPTKHLEALIAQSHIVQNHVRGMLFRRALFEDNHLRFTPGVDFGEDYSLLPQLVYHSKSLASLTDYLYFYRMENEGSYMNNITPKRTLSYLKANDIVYRFILSLPEAEHFTTALVLGRLNIMKWIRWRGLPLESYLGSIAGAELHFYSPLLKLYEWALLGDHRVAIKLLGIINNLPVFITTRRISRR